MRSQQSQRGWGVKRRETPIRVLHVDDEPPFARLVSTFLEDAGDDIEVLTEHSASDGLDRLATTTVDCIVSDYQMPETDGLAFLEAVRERYPDLPFILFTGQGSEEIASEAISAGVTDYLQKGTGTERYTILANRVRNAVSGNTARQALEESEARYRSMTEDVLDNAAAGIVVVDASSTVVWVNSAVENFFGVDADRLVGEDTEAAATALAEATDGLQLAARLRRSGGATPDSEPVECHVRPNDDRAERWLEHRSTPIETGVYAGGRVEYFTDLTEIKERELALQESEQYRRRLYEITADTSLNGAGKIQRLLDLGCERLRVENGHLVRIDAETNRHEVLRAAGSDLVQAGSVTDLSETYCRKTISSDDLLGVHDAPVDGWADDPAYDRWGIGCYIGGKLIVEDELFGTLCFANRAPRDEAFSHTEKAFVDLMSRWISHVLEREEHESRAWLKYRAMDAAPIGITIADATQADNPIVYANDGFERLTGYAADDVHGRNCRFLQGDDTDPEPVAAMREAIDAAKPVSVELLNYRADGSPFWNRVDIAPVENDAGDVTHFVGFQQEVTDRRDRD